MSERNTSDYELSRADNNSIFWDRIVPDLLVGASSQEDPQLTIVLAQHGAGKTQLVNQTIVPSFNEFGGVVDIDSDRYKRYHPAYDELMGDGGADMARLTGLDGQRWMRQVLQYCRDNRKHTLVQETAQNPPFLVDMIELSVDIKDETIWATQRQIASIFEVKVPAISKHISNIVNEGELDVSTISKKEIVQMEAGRDVSRSVSVYNLDMIIAVGYRIGSRIGTEFRKWATSTLRKYIVDGFAINPARIEHNKPQFLRAIEGMKLLAC